jgi:hypothetical protein
MKISSAATFTLAIASVVESVLAAATPAKTPIKPREIKIMVERYLVDVLTVLMYITKTV